MKLPFLKSHHRRYLLQSVGFVGLALFTIITVMVGNSVYRYASLLRDQNAPMVEVEYAIFNEKEEPSEESSAFSALLTFFRY